MISEFSKLAGYPELDILGKGKRGHLCDARHVYWYILHKNGFNASEAARVSGVRHSSVIFAIKKVTDLLELNDNYITELYERTKDIKR
jgi:chromosomal replication initiation ATPase DnaA